MQLKHFFTYFIFLLIPAILLAQNATLKGIVLDDTSLPIPDVNIKAGNLGTTTNINGFYILKIPANQDVTIQFTHLNHKNVTVSFNLKNGEEFEFNPVMSLEVEQISQVVIKSNERKPR